MKDKIKLLFITGIFYPLIGGPTVALDTIIPKLLNKERIVEITILTTYVKDERLIGSKDYSGVEVKIYRLLIPRKSIFEGSRIYHRPFQALRVIHNGLMIISVCLIDSIDIVHDVFRYEYLSTRIMNVPSVMDVRSLGREEPMFKPEFLIAVSDKIYEMHRKWCEESSIQKVPIPLSKVHVGEKEVNKVKEKYGLEADYICFVGRLSYDKGVDLAIEGFRYLQEKMDSIHLVLIGGAEELKDIETINDIDPNNSDKTHVLGEIDHGETLSLMKGSEVVVLPSRKEGVPRTILEALQMNKKVLAPECVQEFKDQIPKFVIKEESPKAVADRLKTIIDADSVPDYDLSAHEPEKVAERWIDIYDGLLAKG